MQPHACAILARLPSTSYSAASPQTAKSSAWKGFQDIWFLSDNRNTKNVCFDDPRISLRTNCDVGLV